jgi:twitching motility protein PilT
MAITDISELLTITVKRGGSDLHISTGNPPMIRIHGEMEGLEGASEPLGATECRRMIYDVLKEELTAKLERDLSLDLSISYEGLARFRVNVFHQIYGLGAVFRIIPEKIPHIDKLGLPECVKKLIDYHKGLVLVTGPTGSGKSTTLASIIDCVNETRKGHIITIENPVEFIHKKKNCVINQREVGPSTHSFSDALRDALREDPDYILVGEMRDLETISLAITAAETGHLVFGTLHTSSAAKTIDRIIDAFPAGQQNQIKTMLSESIQAILAQTLMKRKDGSGRIPAVEILIGTSAVRNLIREGKTYQIMSMIQTGRKDGMQSLDQSLKDLLIKGLISREDAYRYAVEKESFSMPEPEPEPEGEKEYAGQKKKFSFW